MVGLIVLLVLLAALFGGVGIAVEGLQWLLVVGIVLMIASLFTGYRGYSGRDHHH